MKVKFAVYMQNIGDGSTCARFFKTSESAERYAEKDSERFCDDVYEKELEFDENGVLITDEPQHWTDFR